jgi:hypothetical protein
MKIIITEDQYNKVLSLYETLGDTLTPDRLSSPKGQTTKEQATLLNQYYKINLSAATTGNWKDKDYNDALKKFMEEKNIPVWICQKGDGYCSDDDDKVGEVTTKDFGSLKRAMNELKGQQQGKVNTDHDKAYDYQLNNGKYYFKGKPNTEAGRKYPNWVEAKGAGLESIKKNVKFV